MKKPFAYVLYIDRSGDPEPRVSLYQTLQGAEAALRSYAAGLYIGLCDDEIVEALAEHERVRIFAVTQKGNKQTSAEVQPFVRAKEAA